MTEKLFDKLSSRERQIMEVIYRNGKATAAEIRRAIDDAPSYSAIRAFLRILTKKGYVGHEQDGPRYVYFPQVDREKVQRSMINKVLDFFNGSAESVVATLLDISKNDLTEDDFERLTQLIQRAKREGR